MGEARQRALSMADALKQDAPMQRREVRLDTQHLLTVLVLDGVNNAMAYASSQLENVVKNQEAANVVRQALSHLFEYRQKFIAANEQKVLIASPGDVPPPKVG